MTLIADQKDIPALVVLINSAYRGEASRKGWTTEADFLEGDQRIDSEALAELFSKPGSVILKYVDNNKIYGCVYLQKNNNELYLGMLSVDPLIQNRGIGKKLLKAAEVYARQNNCGSIVMQVISIRKELIDWYEKHGYKKTGETKPFPSDNKFGTPMIELEFSILKKLIR